MKVILMVFVSSALFGQNGASLHLDDRDVKSAELPTAFSFTGGNYRHNGLIIPLPTKGLEITAVHFGALEGEVGVVGIAKRFRPKHWISFTAGGGTIFGHGERTGPALLASVDVERHISRHNTLLAEASVTQAFRTFPEPEHHAPQRSNHDQFFLSSIGWKHKSWVLRGYAERFHHRDEMEWSGGPGLDRLIGHTGLYVSGSVFFPGKPVWIIGIGFTPSYRHKE